MLAVAKTPHIKLRIEGDIPNRLLRVLKEYYGKMLILDGEDDYVDVFETDWYKHRSKNITPGKSIRIYRENKNWTQTQLGGKLGGLTRQYVSDLENGRREVSKNIAKALSALFHVSINRFIK